MDHIFLLKCRVPNIGFRTFPGVLEVLGSSGRLVGIVSTYPGISPMHGAELWPKLLRGDFLSTVPTGQILAKIQKL